MTRQLRAQPSRGQGARGSPRTQSLCPLLTGPRSALGDNGGPHHNPPMASHGLQRSGGGPYGSTTSSSVPRQGVHSPSLPPQSGWQHTCPVSPSTIGRAPSQTHQQHSIAAQEETPQQQPIHPPGTALLGLGFPQLLGPLHILKATEETSPRPKPTGPDTPCPARSPHSAPVRPQRCRQPGLSPKPHQELPLGLPRGAAGWRARPGRDQVRQEGGRAGGMPEGDLRLPRKLKVGGTRREGRGLEELHPAWVTPGTGWCEQMISQHCCHFKPFLSRYLYPQSYMHRRYI